MAGQVLERHATSRHPRAARAWRDREEPGWRSQHELPALAGPGSAEPPTPAETTFPVRFRIER